VKLSERQNSGAAGLVVALTQPPTRWATGFFPEGKAAGT